MSDRNQKIIDEFRANEGKVGGFFKGRTLLILHTVGAKSGEERVNPLATFEEGDKLVIVASKGGAPTNPDWYYNLLANPIVEVEYGTERFRAEARVTSEPERSYLYEKMINEMAAFADYREKANREIPVITLTRIP